MNKNNQDVMAELERLRAENESLKAENAAKDAKAAERAQLNGWLTIPKGQRRDLEGKRFECTLKISGTFGNSKNGNVSARLTTKVPFTSIQVAEPAAE
jgi:hypothetical protein